MDNKNLSQSLLQYVLIFAILLLSVSASYYFLKILPDQNNRKIQIIEEEAKIKKEAEEQKLQTIRVETFEKEEANKLKEEAKAICLAEARVEYSKNWKFRCIRWKKHVDKSWEDCIATPYSWQTSQQRKEECKRQTPDYEEDDSNSCLLPSSYSEKVESSFKASIADCNV